VQADEIEDRRGGSGERTLSAQRYVPYGQRYACGRRCGRGKDYDGCEEYEPHGDGDRR